MSEASAPSTPERGEGSTVDVSVLVPVLNEEEHIRQTVRAMQAQTFDGMLEFLFADGCSHDRTKAILEGLAGEDPRIRVFDNPRRRTPSGLNVCLRQARGRFVARMDAHTFYPSEYVAEGVHRLGRGDTSWVSGPVIPEPRGRVSRAVALALGSPLGRGGGRKWASQRADTSEIELDSGVFAGVWPRDVVVRLGGWDEGWPQNQDSEMAGRFLRDGEKLICLSSMGARYIPRDSLRGLFKQYNNYGFYRIKTARRHPQTLRPTHALAPAVAVTLVASIVSPRPLRRLARAGTVLYGAALVLATGQAASRADHLDDALSVPGVLVAMHMGHAVGMLRAAARLGPPWAAIATAAGLDGLAQRLTGPPEPVWAPSLSGDGEMPESLDG
jgi:succinoglycan biosynthesis protein ExoA